MTVSFTKVKMPNGWLSNMSPHRVLLNEFTWKTAEHAFQALRLPPYHPVRINMNNVKSPMMAKMVVKSYRSDFVYEPGSEEDLDLMREVTWAKLQTNPELKELLRATGNEQIVEDVTSRNKGSGSYWGAAWSRGEWIGENWLGRIWMEHRTRIFS